MNRFIWPARIYYEDTDSGGVVYYANYLKFLERARTEWLRSLGFELDVLSRDSQVMFVVRKLAVDYHRPARFNDLLHVHTSIAEARRASLRFAQTIVRSEGPEQQLLCTGNSLVACVATDSFKPRPVPQAILAEIFGDN
ncbi:MAG: tol-pal system-associated acyl-CoA thioesterase [Gammaproteobacteria bacterium]|nr:tol-pal system-associated acyl-CoA thioesterase [Gammaproteobacteria bacterium]MCP5425073.1 tol-pal system-associated acyl-CoA thioesterase [Gammaproteobacteria bacterium]